MKTSILKAHSGLDLSCAIAIAAAAVSCAAPALADPITGQVGIASEYIGKGLGKSDEQPAAFGSVRWETRGFYASAFESEAASSKGGNAEVIVTAGYATDIQKWGVDMQVMHRQIIGETNGVDSGYVEFQTDLSRDLTDRISARMRVNYSPDTYGAGQAAWWSEAQGALKLTSKDKLSVAYGVRRVDNGSDYNAWNIGVKHKFSPAIAGDLRGFDTDEHDLGSRYHGRLVASLSYSF